MMWPGKFRHARSQDAFTISFARRNLASSPLLLPAFTCAPRTATTSGRLLTPPVRIDSLPAIPGPQRFGRAAAEHAGHSGYSGALATFAHELILPRSHLFRARLGTHPAVMVPSDGGTPTVVGYSEALPGIP